MTLEPARFQRRTVLVKRQLQLKYIGMVFLSVLISSLIVGRFGRTSTCESAGITTGRLVSVCGAIGVMTRASTAGCTIGPPAARL